ncbi:MAG: HupE/UreJ family protein, partial [Pikeienuella sp.]
IAAMLVGVFLVVGGIQLPIVEPVIALSLVVLGGLVARGKALTAPVAMAVFAALGVFHGWAFGGSLAGQEGGASAAVLVGYLLGLAAIQYAIAVGFGMVVAKVWNAKTADAISARLSGAVVAGVGAFLVLEVAEGAAFAALGLS